VPSVQNKATQKLNVLIADDHLINQLFIQAILTGTGHSCFVAHNGVEVLSLLEEQVYDLVLMDGQMPVMDGYDATAEIRRREQAAGGVIQRKHIIAVTASGSKYDEKHCLDAGMDDYIAKPIDPKVLLSKIEAISRAKTNAKYNQVKSILEVDQNMLSTKALASIKPDDLKKIVIMMLEFLPLAYQQLIEAYELDDPIRVSQIAHNLAGSTSMVDVAALFKASILLEQTARDGDLENIEPMITELKPLIDDYIDELSKLIKAL